MTDTRLLFDARSRGAWRLLLAAGLATASWLAFSPVDAPDGIEHLDKVQHMAAFTSLALAASFSWPSRPRTTAFITAGLMAYGLFIELVQTQLPTRSGSAADWLADAVGVAAGLLLARALRPHG